MNLHNVRKIQGDTIALMRWIEGRGEAEVARQARTLRSYLEKGEITESDAISLVNINEKYGVRDILGGLKTGVDSPGAYKSEVFIENYGKAKEVLRELKIAG